MFDLPYVIADATSITEAGYSGDDVDSMIVRLINSADGDIELAQQGIVFIDEIDKKGKKSESSTVGRDISGEGVQQALLKLIEGTTLDISLDDELVEFDTTNILFIFSGAFVGLTYIIQKNRSKTSIGFGANIQAETAGMLKDVNSQDLIKYGMIPEFLGRCPVTVVFDDLTVDTLVQILKEPKNSIISQFQTLFKMDGVRLEFDDEYLKTVATECINQKLGARGLRTIIERHLQETQFMLPRLSKEGINKITVDATGAIKHTKRVKRRVSGSK
jgi:ATP-dependent Clp protease ATP-binding subunit ClpX